MISRLAHRAGRCNEEFVRVDSVAFEVLSLRWDGRRER
jgi:hypothetical protein